MLLPDRLPPGRAASARSIPERLFCDAYDHILASDENARASSSTRRQRWRELVRARAHPAGGDRAARRDRLLQQARRRGRARSPSPDAQASPQAEQAVRQFFSEGLAAGEIVDTLRHRRARTGPRSRCSPTSSSTRSRGEDRAPQRPDPAAREAAQRRDQRPHCAPTRCRPRSSASEIQAVLAPLRAASSSQAPRSSQRLVEIAKQPARRPPPPRAARPQRGGSRLLRRAGRWRRGRREPTRSSPRSLTSSCRSIRTDLTVDWADRESSEAAIRRKIRRLLRQHHYQPAAATAGGRRRGVPTTSSTTRSSCSSRPRRSTGTSRKSRGGCLSDLPGFWAAVNVAPDRPSVA